MPLYEYLCLDCGNLFEELRSMSDADVTISCEACGGDHTSRKISLFAAHSEGKLLTGGHEGCSSCRGGVCATCGV